ncbi:Single-stranded DNA-binding protein [uncultured Pleomorphomonas sp.]|uniref:Single-stranded DNA-binding protein n=1 Tax=uncultured Pleomorphomonas sp. TaxID=442121 RepID=A0A212L7F3_9HYPH|nr:single-stranded DNA-binding protein [uncultured Pleomorphomonas sp.]SCM73481.1 Single-stranded DNA-binding protein [uncultured Pleomorphomonas sp.]
MSINRVILLGNVGRPPEIRAIPDSSDRVATFTLATTDRWRDRTTGEQRQATEWHQVVCHNQTLVKLIADHVAKGSKVAVEGKIKTRKYTKDGVERRVTEIVIGRFDGGLTLEGDPKAGSEPGPAGQGADLDDSIPY